MVAGVATEAALVDPAFGRAVEGQAHLFQVQHGVDGFLGHDLGCVLVNQVVATLDGVEGVPLPVVFLDVGQCCTHATLGCTCVRAGGVELGQYRGACTLTGFDRGAHAGATCTDNNDVVLMDLHTRCSLFQKFRWSAESVPLVGWPVGTGRRNRYGAGQNPPGSWTPSTTGHGSKVKITRVPRMTMTNVAAYRTPLSQKRVESFSA